MFFLALTSLANGTHIVRPGISGGHGQRTLQRYQFAAVSILHTSRVDVQGMLADKVVVSPVRLPPTKPTPFNGAITLRVSTWIAIQTIQKS